MPLVYQQNINNGVKIAVWHIEEPENFFTEKISPQREITHSHKRLQHLAGRLLLEELMPGFPFESIRIADTKKPFLENDLYHFSISHSGDFAAAIVSLHNRVGVDVEVFLDEEEQFRINEMKHLHPFTSAWSIKETLYKWNGESEIDFIEHIHIKSIIAGDDDQYKAICLLKKNIPTQLDVQIKFFKDFVLSWCVG
jgi:phosphopantetheinyl transferase